MKQCAASIFVTTVLTVVMSVTTPVSSFASAPAIGINLEGVSDWTTSELFVDLVLQSRHWGTPSTPWDEAASIDTNGWPTTDAGVVLSTEASPVLGTYFLKFSGIAVVTGTGGSTLTVENQSYNSGSNTTTAKVVVSAGPIDLSFTSTQRTASSAVNTGITNVHLYRPGYPTDGSVVFTTPVQNLLSNFSVIRFMDDEQTNGNLQVNWTDRRLPSYATQSGAGPLGGVAWEYLIELCNETGRDAYINIPEGATDSYITSLAKLFRDGDTVNGVTYPGLAPNLHLYIEWSNEVWNSEFQQCGANYTAAQAEVAAGGSPLNFDGETNSWYFAWRRVAKRIVDTSIIFRTVFGDSQMISRIRPVLEWQYDNGQDTAEEQMTLLFNYYDNGNGIAYVTKPHPPSYYLWGAGGATYYTSNNDGAATVNALFASGIPNTGFGSVCNIEADWAHAFGLNDIAYEGGWGVGNSSTDSAIQEDARFDSRAATSLIAAQQDFETAGGNLDIFYSSSAPVSSTWGMTDQINDLSVPLYSAVSTINNSSAVSFNNGTLIPAISRQWISLPLLSTSVSNPWGSGPQPLFSNGNGYQGYLIETVAGGEYQIELSTANTTPGGLIGVYIDGSEIGTVRASAPSASLITTPGQVFTVHLTPGVHGVVVSAQKRAPGGTAGQVTAILVRPVS